MNFKNIMLNEMSRASDRTFGKNSINNILYILRDYTKKLAREGKTQITYNALRKFLESYGLDWNQAAKAMKIPPAFGTSKSRVDLLNFVKSVAKQNNIDLNADIASVDSKKDYYDELIDLFWDYYEAVNDREKSRIDDITTTPDFIQLIKLFKENPDIAEDIFGRHIDTARKYLQKFIMGEDYDGSPEEAIDLFWDWHRDKKAGDIYNLDKKVLEKLAEILESENAIEIVGDKGLYFYMAKSVGEMLGRKLLAPGEEKPLQKELKRIMAALDNPEYIDQIEAEEKKRLSSANTYTAGLGGSGKGGFGDFGGFSIPAPVLRRIAAVAAEEGSVDKTKIGKVSKEQVKDCYRYCMNQLNRKFHVGQRGAFEGTLQEFYDMFKIVFVRGYTLKTLHKIFDEVTTFMVDQLDKDTADYWKNKEDITGEDDFNESVKLNEDYTEITPEQRAKYRKLPKWQTSYEDALELGYDDESATGIADMVVIHHYIFDNACELMDKYNKEISESKKPLLNAALKALYENNYVAFKHHKLDENVEEPNAEKIIFNNYDMEEGRHYGPDRAYEIALIVSRRQYPDVEFPENRYEFEELYGYDIDDPPSEKVDELCC